MCNGLVHLLLLLRIKMALELVHIPPFFSPHVCAWPFVLTWKTNCILNALAGLLTLLEIYFVHLQKLIFGFQI